MKSATRDSKDRCNAAGMKPEIFRRTSTDGSSISRPNSTDSCKVEGRTRSTSRLSTETSARRDNMDIHKAEGRTKSSSNLGRRSLSRTGSQESRTIERRSSSRLGAPLDPQRCKYLHFGDSL